MGKVLPDGKEEVRVSATTSRILRDEEDLSQWDDEEIARGQRRDPNGVFYGRETKLIPRPLLDEHHRRLTVEAVAKMRENAIAVVDYSLEVMLDSNRIDTVRLRASENLANRIWGKPKEYVNLDIRGETPFEQFMNTLAAKVGGEVDLRFGGGEQSELTDGDVIDAELVEDDHIEDDVGGWSEPDDDEVVCDNATPRYPMGRA